MASELLIKNDILISATTATVWDALTNPQQTKKYMYGCETISDWKPGGELLWQGEWEGKKMVFAKGKILKIEDGNFLTYTTFDPNNTAIADAPENYLTVTYSLTVENGQTKLTVTQGDYNNVQEGEKRYNDAAAAGGWSSILEKIKELVENPQ